MPYIVAMRLNVHGSIPREAVGPFDTIKEADDYIEEVNPPEEWCGDIIELYDPDRCTQLAALRRRS